MPWRYGEIKLMGRIPPCPRCEANGAVVALNLYDYDWYQCEMCNVRFVAVFRPRTMTSSGSVRLTDDEAWTD